MKILITGGCGYIGSCLTKMINDKERANIMVFGDAGSATLLSKGKNEIVFSRIL